MSDHGKKSTTRRPYDGRLTEYVFGKEDHWKIEALTLRRAVRMFRVGVMFPHRYSTARIATKFPGERGYEETRYLASEAGAKVSVRVYDERHHEVQKTWGRGGSGGLMFRIPGVNSITEGDPRNTEPVMEWIAEWVTVVEIEPEDPESEYRPDMLPAAVHAAADEMLGSSGTALTRRTHLTGLATKTRPEMATHTLELQRMQGELEVQRQALEAQKRELMEKVTAMNAEMAKRMEQIWFIELFLGSKEEVKLLRDGEPAPADTLITVYQQVLCMDEEIAVWTWMQAPETIGSFDYENLEDFDDWLLLDPAHLDLVLPAKKGIRALRVRRNPKYREDFGDIGVRFQHMEEEKLDEMVYLLVRNGERVYRLWVDVRAWPRFFPRVKEWDWMDEHTFTEVSDGTRYDHGPRGSEEDKVKSAKTFLAGLVVVQGLVLRSDLFDPQPMAEARLDIFDPSDVETYFELVREDEGDAALTDGSDLSRVTWPGYREWLKGRVMPGVRCFFVEPKQYESLKDRVGFDTVDGWPEPLTPYAVDKRNPWGVKDDTTAFSFLYQPGDQIWVGESWGYGGNQQRRQKRVRFNCRRSELWPAELISWRVVEHLIQDRSQRRHYEGFFVVFSRWRKYYLEQRERERPFVDAVLQQVGFADPRLSPVAARARVERLLRWWKMKTKRHRPLGEDEDKAVRMVLKGYRRGEESGDDPERDLFRSLT